jgi:hypothetical protein
MMEKPHASYPRAIQLADGHKHMLLMIHWQEGIAAVDGEWQDTGLARGWEGWAAAAVLVDAGTHVPEGHSQHVRGGLRASVRAVGLTLALLGVGASPGQVIKPGQIRRTIMGLIGGGRRGAAGRWGPGTHVRYEGMERCIALPGDEGRSSAAGKEMLAPLGIVSATPLAGEALGGYLGATAMGQGGGTEEKARAREIIRLITIEGRVVGMGQLSLDVIHDRLALIG